MVGQRCRDWHRLAQGAVFEMGRRLHSADARAMAAPTVPRTRSQVFAYQDLMRGSSRTAS
jgi:hypothetical protein